MEMQNKTDEVTTISQSTFLTKLCGVQTCLGYKLKKLFTVLLVLIIIQLLVFYTIFQRKGTNKYTKTWSIDSNNVSPHDHMGDNNVVRDNNAVHYIVDNSTYRIQLQHFISVFSAVRFLKPNVIMFHAITWPWEESYWWRAILQISPRVVVNKVVYTEQSGNNKGAEDKYKQTLLKLLILKQHGGIVLTFNTIVRKYMDSLKSFDLTVGESSGVLDGSVMIAKKNSISVNQWFDAVAKATTEAAVSQLFTTYSIELSKKISTNVSSVNFVEMSLIGIMKPVNSLEAVRREKSPFGDMVRSVLYNKADPITSFVPRIVHFFWNETTDRELNFIEYMSIKSAYRIFKPKKIYFYIVHLSKSPHGSYWDDIRELENFAVVKLTGQEYPAQYMEDLKGAVLENHGGIFLNLSVIAVSDIELFLAFSGVVSFDKEFGNEFIMLKPKSKYRDILETWQKRSATTISNGHTYLLDATDTLCFGTEMCQIQTRSTSETLGATYDISSLYYIRVDDSAANDYTPTTIQMVNSTFGHVVRQSLNGYSDIVDPRLFVVPNIIHYVWFGQNKPYKLHNLIGVYSAYVKQRPDKIYFHHETVPVGPWWEKVRKLVPIEMVKMVPPSSIFGQPIRRFIEHKADVARLEILLKYGGIYLDTDVFVLRSLDPLRSHPYRVGAEYPADALCNCIILSAKNSSFLKLFYESYRHFQDDCWGCSAIVVPYTLSVSNRPDKIVIGPTDRMLVPSWQVTHRMWNANTYVYWKDNYFMHLYGKAAHPKAMDSWDKELYSAAYNTSLAGSASRFFYEKFLSDYSKISR